MDYLKDLKRFKAANKVYKLKLAQKAGFATIEEYATFLAKETGTTVRLRNNVKVPMEETSTPKEEVFTIKEYTTSVAPPPDLLDLVIAFDSTSSMNMYIDAVKSHVTTLIPKMLQQNPNVNIGVVVFGDYCDMTNGQDFGKAYQVLSPTRDESKLKIFVSYAQATRGGDGDEFYELVIQKIHKETPWREGASKSILLIGDANPHDAGHRYRPGYPVSPAWKAVCEEAAKDGIIIDTLDITRRTFYKEVAKITGGICMPFNAKDVQKTSQLLEATGLARGGKSTEKEFLAKSISSEVTTDRTMNTIYFMYKTMK